MSVVSESRLTPVECALGNRSRRRACEAVSDGVGRIRVQRGEDWPDADRRAAEVNVQPTVADVRFAATIAKRQLRARLADLGRPNRSIAAVAVALVATGTGRTFAPDSDAVNRSRVLSPRPRVLSSLQATSKGRRHAASAHRNVLDPSVAPASFRLRYYPWYDAAPQESGGLKRGPYCGVIRSEPPAAQ